jgi:hypothetical protein
LFSVGCNGLNWLAPKEPQPPQTVRDFVGLPRVKPAPEAEP